MKLGTGLGSPPPTLQVVSVDTHYTLPFFSALGGEQLPWLRGSEQQEEVTDEVGFGGLGEVRQVQPLDECGVYGMI